MLVTLGLRLKVGNPVGKLDANSLRNSSTKDEADKDS